MGIKLLNVEDIEDRYYSLILVSEDNKVLIANISALRGCSYFVSHCINNEEINKTFTNIINSKALEEAIDYYNQL